MFHFSQQIAFSLQEQPLKRSDSHNSMVSIGSVTSQEVANINNEGTRQRLSGLYYLHENNF